MKDKGMQNPTCVGAGFVALDIIYAKGQAPSFLAGGSCGNVMTTLSYMGWNTYPVARLGNDAEGRRIIQDMKGWGVDTRFVETEEGSDSPRVIERIFGGENPRHQFHMKCRHGNWLPRRKPFLLRSLGKIRGMIPKSDFFYFDRAAPSSYEIARNLKDRGAVIVFEPQKFLPNDRTFLKCLRIADIVKCCRVQAEGIDSLGSNLPLEIQTMGSRGLRYKAGPLGQHDWKELPAVPAASLVDAAGSGDWLTSGMIHMLRNLESLECLTRHMLEQALKFGQELASLNCGYAGARGMMYHLSKKQLTGMLAGIPGGRTPARVAAAGRPSKMASELDAECRACLCREHE